MAINVKINVQSGIGKITTNQSRSTKIVAQNFSPPPLTLATLGGVSTAAVLNGQTLVYNSATGLFESNVAPIVEVTGGDF
jgi:hypothetical protein